MQVSDCIPLPACERQRAPQSSNAEKQDVHMSRSSRDKLHESEPRESAQSSTQLTHACWCSLHAGFIVAGMNGQNRSVETPVEQRPP